MKTPELTRTKQLETILTLSVAPVVFYLLGHRQHPALLWIALGMGAVGLTSTYLTAKISWAWYKLGELMGMVTGKVILVIVFFVFLLPIALLSRVFSKGSGALQLHKTSGPSYFIIRNHRYTSADLKNVW